MKVTAKATANDHARVMVEMKSTARDRVVAVQIEGENKLRRSKIASAAARSRLKVS
jgi:hypothetical protein